MKIFGQSCNVYFISFEGTGTGENSPDHKLSIDTISNPDNIWQKGHPQKTVFSSAYSNPNAIVTDTLNYYPTNDTSSFILSHIAGAGFAWDMIVEFGAVYYVNSDSLADFGTIEFSPNNGTTWINLITDTIYAGIYTWGSGKPVFTGNSDGWKQFVVRLEHLGPTFNIQFGDTVMFRFTFISDGIQSNKDGLMFDNLSMYDATPIGIENINLADTELSFYPNPIYDILTIETLGKSEIKILNIAGQIIKTINTEEKQTTINVADLSSGIYIIKAKTERGVAVKKFIKE